MRNQVQLITYVDRLAGDLTGLIDLLTGPLDGVFGGVHLLPFFHPIDGADAGFDPIDHTTVDTRLGTWEDVGALGAEHDVMADVIVNHVSAQSPQFLDWQRRGDDSDFAGMFLTYDAVYPDGATEAELMSTYRPRPGLPFTVLRAAGVPRVMWTTFTSNQIDLDVSSDQTRAYFTAILDRMVASGVNLIRLDAVGYAIKKRGTSSFMIPETFDFIEELAEECRARGITMLVEVHSYYRSQIEIADRVDLVYDFALPPLVLDALYTADGGPLKAWIEMRPTNCVTVLDTHDGIGVIDVGAHPQDGRPGLLAPNRLDALVERIHAESGGTSRQATGGAATNLDLYQVNCTFFDALGGDVRRYLVARLIQVLVPGVPQIYYVGLLLGRNDLELLERTNVGRDINRHYYTTEEVHAALGSADVADFLALYRWRNGEPAFAGRFELLDSADDVLSLKWSHGGRHVRVEIGLNNLHITTQIRDRDRVVEYEGLDFCL
ncbi:MAG: sucrose phosphorylase [Acidimicrobiales bacterium]|nr:sucrose phosphorylase [Acidimicrobiales bacterium]